MERHPRPGCWPREPSARSPAATTRWWPPGTAWRSPRWPRPAPCSTGRTGSRPPSRAATCSCRSTSGRGEHGDRLVRVSRDGRPGRHAGVLEDHADVAEGFLALYSVTGDEEWLAFAGVLLDVVLGHFRDGRGGFFDTADDADRWSAGPRTPRTTPPRPVRRPRPGPCSPTRRSPGPSCTGPRPRTPSASTRPWGRCTRGSPGGGWPWPRLSSTAPARSPSSGRPSDARTRELRRVALAATAPGAVVAVGDPAEAPRRSRCCATVRSSGGAPTAYVCRHFVCEAPVTTVAALGRLLGSRDDLPPTAGEDRP